MASIMAVSNETKSTTSRVTKEGKHLTYEMEVIQQPERARACGSGAKSSADRRPVDPPPVVQLRIYEGEAKQDVTFSYNANFFLYTTLESARPIAQGRVPTVPAPFPVLTGMPVAGMAYLDRPDPAGYFIFPDLSVRHEGKYRLSFNLFEELKDSKDADSEPITPSPEATDQAAVRSNPMAPQAHVHFRLEVKSVPFAVFSAKKFPGLAESTQLSRVVAEQGCRVRIRRDVRMRRRDTKASQNYDEFDDEVAYARSSRYVTPDMYAKSQMPDRPRSTSHGSVDMPTPYSVEQRRLSAHEVNYFNQSSFQPTAPPPQPTQPANSGLISHLSFGGTNTMHYPIPAFQPPTPIVAPPPQSYAPSANGFQYPSSAQSRQISVPRKLGYHQPLTQQPLYPQPQAYPSNNEYLASPSRMAPSPEYHIPSGSNSQIHTTQPINSYVSIDQRQPQVQQSYYPPPMQSTVPRPPTPLSGQLLPPLKSIHAIQPVPPPYDNKYEPAPPVTALPTSAITPSTGSYAPYASTPPSATTSAHLGKRAYGSVFDSGHLSQPMHSGMRPSNADVGQDVLQIETEDGLEDDYEIDLKMLSYKRADGSRQLKKCPSPLSE